MGRSCPLRGLFSLLLVVVHLPYLSEAITFTDFAAVDRLTRHHRFPHDLLLFADDGAAAESCYNVEVVKADVQTKLMAFLRQQQWFRQASTCRTWAVVTTERPEPTAAIIEVSEESKRKDASLCLLVVAAGSEAVEAAEYRLDGGIYLSIAMQQEMATLSHFVAAIPWHAFARRNVGFLIAVLSGAEAVWDFQDDCRVKAPAESQLRRPGSQGGPPLSPYRAAGSSPGTLKAVSLCDPDQSGAALNPYSLLRPSLSPSWPRGFPLDGLKEDRNVSLCRDPNQAGSRARNTVGVVQFLVDEEPDVDAYYQLALPLPLTFSGLSGDSDLLVLPKRVLAPYNTQATLHFHDALYGLLLPSTVTGRVADIWRSYFTQPQLWAAGLKLAFAGPEVVRDPQDEPALNGNDESLAAEHLQSEEHMHRTSSALTELLATWSSDRASAAGWMEHLWADMYSYGLIGAADVRLAQLWLEELTTGGYRFPCLVDAPGAPPPGGYPPSDSTGPPGHSGAGWHKPLLSTPPLRGWRMSGGVRRIVPLDASAAVSRAEQTLGTFGADGRWTGSRADNELLDRLREAAAAQPATGPAALSELCSKHCVDDAHCSAWSFQVVRPDEEASHHDVWCKEHSEYRCRCVLVSATPPEAGGHHAYKTHRQAAAEVEPVVATGVSPFSREEWELNYSGVVQRDVRVWRGPGTASPRFLYIMAFNHPVRPDVFKFLVEELLPLCLPQNVDIVAAAPFSPGVEGILGVPWMNGYHVSGWFNAGIIPALAYWRFPYYDGYLLANDDFVLDMWKLDVATLLGTRAWGHFSLDEPKLFTVTSRHLPGNDGWWFLDKNQQDVTLLDATEQALKELHNTPKYKALIRPDSLLGPRTWEEFTISPGITDGYYLPQHLIADFSVLAGLMLEFGVFAEISVSTALALLVPPGDDSAEYSMMGLCNLIDVWESEEERDIEALWSPDCASIHPIKFSYDTRREVALQYFTENCEALGLKEPMRPIVFP